MGGPITSRPIKRVLVLVELEDGAIGAVYSEGLEPDAAVELRTLTPTAIEFNRVTDGPRYGVFVGKLATVVVHDPDFRDPAVESMAQAVMNQWKGA